MMLRAGCYVARQEVPKVAGTCILQLALPESGKDNINNENQVTQEINVFL